MSNLTVTSSPVATIFCPLCHSFRFRYLLKLKLVVRTRIYTVTYGTRPQIVECLNCCLLYKVPISDYELDRQIYQKYRARDSSRWLSRPDRCITDFIERFYDRRSDVIEVGPGETSLEYLFPAGKYHSLVGGEGGAALVGQNSIKAFIDDQNLLSIVGESRFQMCLLFDVFEHLRDPETAFRNISSMLSPGGVLILQTGDSTVLLNRWKLGLTPYFDIPEHRIFLNESCINYLASTYNLTLISSVRVPHKDISTSYSFLKAFGLFFYGCLYRFSTVRNIIGLPELSLLPPFPGRDHLTVVWKKND